MKLGKFTKLVNRAQRLSTEINQIFLDAAHWNANARKAGEREIDPDPDGQLKRAKLALDSFLHATLTLRKVEPRKEQVQ